MNLTLIWRAIQDNGVRVFAALCLVGLTFSLAMFNINGWLVAGLGLLAILAGFFEALGLVFAVMVEDAVRARRPDRAIVALVILLGCAAFNTVGGHQAWDASVAADLETDRQAAQTSLDARRAELLSTAARAQAEIARVPLPAVSSYTGRQEAARETWEIATADARARQAGAERALAALPVVAEVEPRFDERVTWGFLAFLELAKALGLWAIGLAVKPAARAVRSSSRAGGTEKLDPSEIGRRLVSMRRDRFAQAA